MLSSNVRLKGRPEQFALARGVKLESVQSTDSLHLSSWRRYMSSLELTSVTVPTTRCMGKIKCGAPCGPMMTSWGISPTHAQEVLSLECEEPSIAPGKFRNQAITQKQTGQTSAQREHQLQWTFKYVNANQGSLGRCSASHTC